MIRLIKNYSTAKNNIRCAPTGVVSGMSSTSNCIESVKKHRRFCPKVKSFLSMYSTIAPAIQMISSSNCIPTNSLFTTRFFELSWPRAEPRDEPRAEPRAQPRAEPRAEPPWQKEYHHPPTGSHNHSIFNTIFSPIHVWDFA